MMLKKVKIELDQIKTDLGFDDFAKTVSSHINSVKKGLEGKKAPLALTGAIIETLREKSADMHSKVWFEEVGTVQHIGNGVANISGLSQASIDGLVKFQNGSEGMILNLERNAMDVILLGSDEDIQGGSLVTHGRSRLKIPVSQLMHGRVFNALGEPIDGGGEIEGQEERFIERPAPGVLQRTPVNQPLQTGIKIIDALFPIGKGQRELIAGDRQTGKTTLALDTIINQRGKNVTCVYVAIGQKKSSLLAAIDTLKKFKAMEHTIIVNASPDDPPALKYLAPFSGMTIAEYYLDTGRDVLIIFDDLTKHADAYRELSLLLRRPPGREAYPGDIFYLHARLLERACNLHADAGGGSITAIPIIATQQGNISAYIPTNLISICDGQIVLSKERFNKGYKPAVNIGISVSRVGGSAQTDLVRSLANRLKLDLSQFEEVEKFTQFGTELDEATQRMIQRGQRLQSILTQGIHRPLHVSEQALILFAAVNGYIDSVPVREIREYERKLIEWAHTHQEDLMAQMQEEQELTDDIKQELAAMLDAYSQFREGKDNADE
jgi:F-type H+-transporting ATPase subunit alpha